MPKTSRDNAAASGAPASENDKARQALALMIRALEIMDSSEGTGVAGAHLDLAIHRLQEWIDRAPATK